MSNCRVNRIFILVITSVHYLFSKVVHWSALTISWEPLLYDTLFDLWLLCPLEAVECNYIETESHGDKAVQELVVIQFTVVWACWDLEEMVNDSISWSADFDAFQNGISLGFESCFLAFYRTFIDNNWEYANLLLWWRCEIMWSLNSFWTLMGDG